MNCKSSEPGGGNAQDHAGQGRPGHNQAGENPQEGITGGPGCI